MNEKLRELAGRQGMLQNCEVCLGRGWIARWHEGLQKLDSCTCPACAGGRRLPTEAEVRAAIRAAGWPTVRGRRIEADYVSLEVCRPSEQRDGYASAADGVDEDDLVLLALLRALEMARA